MRLAIADGENKAELVSNKKSPKEKRRGKFYDERKKLKTFYDKITNRIELATDFVISS